MKKTRPAVMLTAALVLAAVPLSSQTRQKPSFEVVSIRPSPPLTGGAIRIGGDAQGDRFVMSSATLRMLLQRRINGPATRRCQGKCRSQGLVRFQADG
jgi:hypothetical protein